MGKVYVKGGTPVGSESLCRTCWYSHVMSGFKESEVVTICTRVGPNIVVPFQIYECSGYYDKNKPSWQQMQKLAIHVSPGNPKPVGFQVGAGFGESTVRVSTNSDTDTEDNEDE